MLLVLPTRLLYRRMTVAWIWVMVGPQTEFVQIAEGNVTTSLTNPDLIAFKMVLKSIAKPSVVPVNVAVCLGAVLE